MQTLNDDSSNILIFILIENRITKCIFRTKIF